MYNFDPYNVLLAIATSIPVLLMTAFVLQGPYINLYHLYYTITSFNILIIHILGNIFWVITAKNSSATTVIVLNLPIQIFIK